MVELAPVLERNAQQVSNDKAWHFTCKVGDQIAAAFGRDLIYDLVRERFELWPQQPSCTRREVTTDQAAHARVDRWVSHEHHGMVSERTVLVVTRVMQHDCRRR